MVHRLTSADALPFDIIPLILAWLTNSSHLAAAALTSRTWYQAAVARLYSKIVFGLSQAKSYGRIMSQFEVISKRPELAVHVKTIIIQSPVSKSAMGNGFLDSICRTLQLSGNLISLTCTVADIMPNVIRSLIADKQRLTEFRIFAGLSMSEAERLLHIASLPSPTSRTVPLGHSGPELKQLSLDSPTRSVLSVLPTWVKSLKDSLQCLSISSSVDLTPSFLDSILSQLSNIKSLSIQNCTFISHADILRLTKHHFTTLESLTLTVHRNANENTDLSWPKLVSLKHLTINIPRTGMTTSKFESTVRAVLSVTSHSALESITFRNTSSKKPSIVLGSGGEASSGRALGPSVIEWVVRAHKSSLKKFNIINFKMGQDLVEQICKECKELRQLALNLDISSHQLSTILSRAPKLATLIDTQTTSGHGGENSNLTVHDVTRLFVENATTLTTIITSARTWTCERVPSTAARQLQDVPSKGRLVKDVGEGEKVIITFQRRRDPYVHSMAI